MQIMRLNPERLRNGVIRAGQPLYVRPVAESQSGTEDAVTAPVRLSPIGDKSAAKEPAARPSGKRGRFPRMDELDLPVLSEADLREWNAGGKDA